jgi:fructokinase
MANQIDFIWGIDLGGTKIEGAVLPKKSSTLPLCRLRLPTEAEKGYDHIVSQVAELITLMSKEINGAIPQRLGIATPGTFDKNLNAMKNCNTVALNGRNLPHDLSRRLGIPVVVANDANCFALAEAKLGAAQNAEVVFGIMAKSSMVHKALPANGDTSVWTNMARKTTPVFPAS